MAVATALGVRRWNVAADRGGCSGLVGEMTSGVGLLCPSCLLGCVGAGGAKYVCGVTSWPSGKR